MDWVQEEIANKWRKLNLKEKATYGSALEGSSTQRRPIPKNTHLKEVREFVQRVVDEQLDKLAEHGPFIPHKPITRSQAK
ncbi:UB-like protease 1A [Prunus dulcis]|uniref:UB-like protease 1A n=1 Tax=Prunus dulcis TaxID=3755 RepID=A0A5H2XQ76_PRUDU|nr:UB-like protease 1A [Prunus dulcis]